MLTQVETMNTLQKFVYVFGATRTEGAAAMKNLLGGKGANLAEMCRLGITVPSGFTISTEACTAFTAQGREAVHALIQKEVLDGVKFLESEMGKTFGDASDPLHAARAAEITSLWRLGHRQQS